MKKTKASKRLLLSVERIRDLQPSELGAVAGGACIQGGTRDPGGGGGGDCGDTCACTDVSCGQSLTCGGSQCYTTTVHCNASGGGL